MEKIIQVEPWIDQNELIQLQRIIETTYVTESHLTKEFEELTKKYTNSNFATAVCNGTAGLFCALKALNIKEDDEVLIPNITFIASATPVILAGAKIRLIDVDPKTACIDINSLKKNINSNTRVIMPVHLYGISCDMEEILKIAKKHKLLILEDASQGVGVKYQNKHVGTFGDFGVLSYYGNKTITTGEGGVVLSKNKELIDKVYQLKNHGRMTKGTFIHDSIGWNFSFTEMQAAIGISQMQKLEKIIERKLNLYNKYLNAIENKNIILKGVPKETTNAVHWFSNVFIENAEDLKEYLKVHSIPSRRVFYPLNLQPCLINSSNVVNINDEFPGSMKAYEKILSLPSSILMNEAQFEYIAEFLNKY